jgi:hypothetical protein
MTELELAAQDLDVVEEYGSTVIETALGIITSGSYPQRYRESTGLAHATIREHQRAFIQGGCRELAGNAPHRRVPTTIGTLAALAGAGPNAHDKHAVIFDERVELLPAVLYALSAAENWICRPRALVVASHIQRCNARVSRPGVWRTAGKGAAYCEAQLLAEGRRLLRVDRASRRFDRSVVRIAWTPIPCDLEGSDDALAAHVLDKLLDVVDRAVLLLRQSGHIKAADLLANVPVCGDSIKFGAPERKGANASLRSYGRRVWLGYVPEVWDVLDARKRKGVFAILPTVETTGKNQAGRSEEPIDAHRLRFGRGTGTELLGKVEAFAAAKPGRAARTARRMRMTPVSESALAKANLDPRASWWQWEALALRSKDERAPSRHLDTAIRRHARTIHVYAITPSPTVGMLAAADASEMHRLDGDEAYPFDLCLGRHRRRFGSAIEISARCRDETWRGAMGLQDALNVAFVAVALSAKT